METLDQNGNSKNNNKTGVLQIYETNTGREWTKHNILLCKVHRKVHITIFWSFFGGVRTIGGWIAEEMGSLWPKDGCVSTAAIYY